MTQNQKIQGKFFPFTQETYQKLKEANLTAGEWRLWGFLVTSIPFGDKYEELPETLSILSECLISKSVFYRAIAKLQDFELFDFQDRGFCARNLSYPNVELVEKSSNSSFSQNWESNPKIGKAVPELGKQSQNWENRSPEPLQDKGGDRSQTIQNIQISQIAEGERKNFSDPDFKIGNEKHSIKSEEAAGICLKIVENIIKKENKKENKEEEKGSQEGSVRDKCSAPPTSPNKKAEEEKYQEKLESLGIEWRRVKPMIARAHESQILGAIAHVEANWEEIKDPSAVFLYQLPKQKIEPLSGGRIFRAAEAGYSLDYVKRLYPSNWREAAAHFGLDGWAADG